jgi:hypothetical protein
MVEPIRIGLTGERRESLLHSGFFGHNLRTFISTSYFPISWKAAKRVLDRNAEYETIHISPFILDEVVTWIEPSHIMALEVKKAASLRYGLETAIIHTRFTMPRKMYP